MKPTKKQREIIFNKYGGRCAYCGNHLQKGWHVDELLPVIRHKNGLCEHPENYNIDNQMPACPSCNINKHSLPLESFRSLIKGFIKHLTIVNTQYKIASRYGLVKETNNDVIFYFEKHKPNTLQL